MASEVPVTKEKAIKSFLLIVAITLLIGGGGIFLTGAGGNVKLLFVVFGGLLIIMAFSAYIGYKYREKIAVNKNKFSYVYIILGVAMVVIAAILIFTPGEQLLSDYVQLAIGFVFIIFGIRKLSDSKKS